MHKELIILAFEKARKELVSKGVNAPSNHQVAILISDFICDDVEFSISKRSIANYYKSAIEVIKSEDINISQNIVVQGLCNYIGYATYKEFILNLKTSEIEEYDGISVKDGKTLQKNPVKSKRNSIILISTSILLIVIVFIVMSLDKQRWMIWNVDHFEEVDYKKEELTNGTLKLFKEERIDNFKKINNPDCDYKFFNEDNTVNVWYGKNKTGELELFSDIGLHPETGKSLKPITTYMIKKYLCDSY